MVTTFKKQIQFSHKKHKILTGVEIFKGNGGKNYYL